MLWLRGTNLSQNMVKLCESAALTFLIISPEGGMGGGHLRVIASKALKSHCN